LSENDPVQSTIPRTQWKRTRRSFWL